LIKIVHHTKSYCHKGIEIVQEIFEIMVEETILLDSSQTMAQL
jgi:hypothetical protein